MTIAEFEQLIEKNREKFYRFAFSILKNHEDAKDAVQEVVLKLWRKRKNLETGNHIDSFCMNAVKNYSFDILRRKKLEKRILRDSNSVLSDNQNIEDKDLRNRFSTNYRFYTETFRAMLGPRKLFRANLPQNSRLMNLFVTSLRFSIFFVFAFFEVSKGHVIKILFI